MDTAKLWTTAFAITGLWSSASFGQFSDAQMETARLLAQVKEVGLMEKGAALVCQSVAGMTFMGHNSLAYRERVSGNSDPGRTFDAMGGVNATPQSATLGKEADLKVLQIVSKLHETYGTADDLYKPLGELTVNMQNECLRSYLGGKDFLGIRLYEASARYDAYRKNEAIAVGVASTPKTGGAPSTQECIANLTANLDPRLKGLEGQRKLIQHDCAKQPGPTVCRDRKMREYRETSSSGGIPKDVVDELESQCNYVSDLGDFPD